MFTIACSNRQNDRKPIAQDLPEILRWQDLLSKARPVITMDPAIKKLDPEQMRWQSEIQRRHEQDAQRLAKQPKVTGSFIDLTLRDALFEISSQTKVPIVIDPSVQGSVMLQLDKVPFETALRMVCFSGGYTYATDGQAYYVGTPVPGTSSYGRLTVSKVMKTFRPADQIFNQLNDAVKAYVSFQEGAKQLVLTGPVGIVERLESDIRQLDKPPAQIEIEVLIVEKKWGDDFDIGVQYDKFQTQINRTFTRGNGTLPITNQLEIISQMAVLFNFLAEEDMAKIHAHPKIITSNGTPAEIKSETEAYVLITTPGVSVLQTELEVIRAGIKLSVTPNLTRNGEIELALEPEISDAVGVSSQSIGGLPLVTRRSSKSTVLVKHGEVLIIGGLYQKALREVTSGVPLLKDMPVLSTIVGRAEKVESSSELLIFVSPRVVE